MGQIRANLPPPGFNHLTHSLSNTTIKLDIPKFDGTDTLNWIFKITQFFDFHQTAEDQRLRTASFYMEGEALTWFQWMFSNGQLRSWQAFLQALELRFAPSLYDDPKGALFKLCQTTTVTEYQTAFESLANRIVGLPSDFYLSCFISGLKPAIRREVQAFQPLSLSHAISLARLQEAKINDRPQPNYLRRTETSPPVTTNTSLTQTNINQRHNIRPALTTTPLAPLTKTPTPIKRLSPAELQARREKGLCYNCDELYHTGHRCQRRFHLLIAEPDPIESTSHTATQLLLEAASTQPLEPESVDDPAQISYHALVGHSVPQTLRVMGRIGKQQVSVLIDGGSTNNFIQDRLVKQLGLELQPTDAFNVLVGNGEELPCGYLCRQLPILLGPNEFFVDFFVLPISGAELVLGVQWLKTLGPILTDYNTLTMKFIINNQTILLQGIPKPHPTEASLHQLKRMISTKAIDTCLQLHLISPQPSPPTPTTTPKLVTTLLDQFNQLFETPTHLPPSRNTDHQIPLQTGTNPVNVRPYRYPHFQKREIETQIREMLTQGIIRPSSSSFSSPVLLVRKKDGTWRFCVDYRALN
ncbi:uncharacterized protein LOC131657638 [Vicia villosa]|uniref:uncharacterized protein LOC131657638 n=1 Tax=Vicia villosa TaxID=3911 RepID=UPI00273C08DD|nr:uncharacterized protein LOC131657638 [Vicia villosa]